MRCLVASARSSPRGWAIHIYYMCCAKPRDAAHVTAVLVGSSRYHRCVWWNVYCARLLDTGDKNKYRQLRHNSSHRQRCISAPFHVMSFWEKSCNESLAKSSGTLIQEASVYGGFVVSRRLTPNPPSNLNDAVKISSGCGHSCPRLDIMRTHRHEQLFSCPSRSYRPSSAPQLAG